LPELITGLELLKQWSPEDSLYAETQNLAEEWSKQVLAIARDKVSQNDLNGALEAIRHIPNTTPVYQEAQELVAYWQKQWQEGAAIDAKAQEALKQQNWTLASELVAVLANFANSYWNTQRANALAQQIGAEKQARQVLARARDAAQGGQPEQFGQAIMIAQAIPQNTYTWQDGRQDLRKWSQTLLAIGSQRWDAGDWAGAVAALQKVPRSTTVPELQDLVRFSTVYTLLHHNVLSQQPSHTWIPSMQQVWSLMEAVAAISQVPSDSPFYQKAQDLEKNLRLQLADLSQLYYAAFWAGLGQKSTLDLAIDQARQILPDRPRRIQAQTLIAHWYDEIERIEDQPYLDRANALAASGEIPDLQAAIAEASLVPQGRALRRTAQGLIAAWRDQIETIEDQPTLDQAWGLANAGNLGEAIDTAQRIRPGRALYNQAQSAIDTWQAQLIRAQQLAVDQPILDRAKALANSGNLYDAIQVAAQIEAGRVLYGEAQGLINTWKAQLNPPRPDPNAVEPDKPDSKPDTLPDWWNEAPERPTDIFIWPDGSLSPYSPPGSDSPDSSTPGSPMPPAVTPSLTPPGSSPANRQPPASAPPSLPSRTAPEPPPSVLPAPAPSSLIESPPAIEAAPPPLPDRSPPDSSHQDSSTRSQNHSSNL
jgi:soluble cytochrome b562